MTTFTRLLPDVVHAPLVRRAALTTAGLAVGIGAIAGPAALATEAHASPAGPAAVVAHADKPGRDGHAKELKLDYKPQPNFYYCGPAATRNALSADGHTIDMDTLAKQMGTTEAGTNSAEDTTKALNTVLGSDKYHTTALSNPDVTPEQMDQLQHDIKSTVDDDRALVANVAGTSIDTDGTTHSYDGGHYIAVVGYRDDGRQALIADSANPSVASYWISTINLANWMATRGYSH